MAREITEARMRELAELLRRVGWTQAELSRRTGYAQTQVSRWMKLRSPIPELVLEYLRMRLLLLSMVA